MTEIELLTPDKIIYSKRKSIALNITNTGDFVVRAPKNCQEEQIYKFIVQKSDWIIKHRLKAKNSYINNTFIIENNAKFNILDETYTILLSNKKKVEIIGSNLLIPIENKEQYLIMFLKKQAKMIIKERVEQFASQFNLKYNTVSISSAKTNWGSCSYNNKLHFTYRLLLCPNDVLNYVIIHELAHTQIKNHSREFWALVANFCPNYKIYNKWLKDNKYLMERI